MLAAAMTTANQHDKQDKVNHEAELRGLMKRVAQNRDRPAFEKLFAHFAPRLKSFMMRKNANAELAEDLVQEAMIAVWTKAGLYEPSKGSVTTWVFTIARNLRIDRIRREAPMPLVELGDYDEASDDPAGDDVLARKQEDQLVSKALGGIPDEQGAERIDGKDVPQTRIVWHDTSVLATDCMAAA